MRLVCSHGGLEFSDSLTHLPLQGFPFSQRFLGPHALQPCTAPFHFTKRLAFRLSTSLVFVKRANERVSECLLRVSSSASRRSIAACCSRRASTSSCRLCPALSQVAQFLVSLDSIMTTYFHEDGAALFASEAVEFAEHIVRVSRQLNPPWLFVEMHCNGF